MSWPMLTSRTAGPGPSSATRRASCQPAHTQPADSPRPLRLSSRAAVAPGDRDPRRASQTDAIVQAVSEPAGAAHM
jgi:hypothetical protein